MFLRRDTSKKQSFITSTGSKKTGSGDGPCHCEQNSEEFTDPPIATNQGFTLDAFGGGSGQPTVGGKRNGSANSKKHGFGYLCHKLDSLWKPGLFCLRDPIRDIFQRFAMAFGPFPTFGIPHVKQSEHFCLFR